MSIESSSSCPGALSLLLPISRRRQILSVSRIHLQHSRHRRILCSTLLASSLPLPPRQTIAALRTSVVSLAHSILVLISTNLSDGDRFLRDTYRLFPGLSGILRGRPSSFSFFQDFDSMLRLFLTCAPPGPCPMATCSFDAPSDSLDSPIVHVALAWVWKTGLHAWGSTNVYRSQ